MAVSIHPHSLLKCSHLCSRTHTHTHTHAGFPLAALLQSRGSGDATTIVCHSKTPLDQLPVLTRMADIVIAAIGVAGYLKADMVKEGAVVIDVGECLLIVVMLVMFAKLCYFRVLYTHTTGKNACRYSLFTLHSNFQFSVISLRK